MKLEDLFSGTQKKIIQGSGLVLLLAIFAQMIVGFMWFSRLSPYLKYAIGSGLRVFQMTACVGVFHLIALIYMIVDIILFIPLKSKFSEKLNSTSKLMGNIGGFLVVTAIGVILALAVSPNALNHGYSGKCYNYIFVDFMLGIDNHPELLTNLDFLTWANDHYFKHVYNNGYNIFYADSYYCDSVGMPTLVLAIIELILIIAFIYGLYKAYKNPSEDDSMAEDDNENDIENNNQEEPKERSIKSVDETPKKEEPKKEEPAKKPSKDDIKDPSDSMSYDNEPDQAPGEKNQKKPEYNDDEES